MSYQIPAGVKAVPKGYASPNASNPTYSLTRGRFVALHYVERELWVVYQHPDGQWVSFCKASPDDLVLFSMAGATQVNGGYFEPTEIA